jgi:hypothetical protein
MDANEFWCRAYLVAMSGQYAPDGEGVRWENHGAPAVYCEAAANAHLAVAQRRGMVTGERTSALGALRELAHDLTELSVSRAKAAASKAGTDAGTRRGGQADGLREAAAVVLQRAGEIEAASAGPAASAAPQLERVEFTAEPGQGGWAISVAGAGWWHVKECQESVSLAGVTIYRIKWGETTPPRPIEVWLERR